MLEDCIWGDSLLWIDFQQLFDQIFCLVGDVFKLLFEEHVVSIEDLVTEFQVDLPALTEGRTAWNDHKIPLSPRHLRLSSVK